MIEFEKEKIRACMPKMLEELEKKKFDAHFFETTDEARQFVVDQISKEETAGVGGSVTVREGLGIVEALRSKGITVYDHWDADGDPPRRLELKRMHRAVDVFLTSMNAITRDGTMVNLDGGGNRVASTCSGPKKVIVTIGANKIVDTLELAIHRTRNHAAVLNAIRLERKVPCVETGYCTDCSAPQRICAALLILSRKPSDIDHFSVILVNEAIGY